MPITFYFDPSCPFSWITSRWLIQVQDQRQLKIDWQPFSLALKNNELGTDVDHHKEAHRLLRVMLASGQPLGPLYTAFGTENHIFGEDYNDEITSKVLLELNLPSDLVHAADDTHYDKALQSSIDAAVAVVGNDVGVPIIIFEAEHGKAGYFGPVLQTLPSVTESLKLWDALAVLATSTSFYELKRTRPDSGPNTASTAVCVP